MSAPRHKVLIGGPRGATATVRSFAKARKRRFSDRLSEAFQTLGDYADTGLSHRAWLQHAIDEASASALRLGQRVRLSTEARILNIGALPIIMRSGVDLDLTGSIIIHTRVSDSDGSSIALRADDISHFSVTGGEFWGPGSWLFGGKVRYAATYAFQLSRCSHFTFRTLYTNGNSGLLLSNCTFGEFDIIGQELNGPGVAIKGGGEGVVGRADIRNSAGFGVYGDEGAGGVHITSINKYMDESKFNQASHPYLWSQLEVSHKTQLNNITGISWADTDGGQLTVTLQDDPTASTPARPSLSDGNQIRISSVVSTPADAFHGDYTIVSRSSQAKQIVVACPVNPGTYTSGGRVADLANTIYSLGEEALGVTYSCFEWTADYVRAHRTGDAGCSLTGNRMHVKHLEAIECALIGGGAMGRGSRYDLIVSSRNGHWGSAVALLGGVGGLVGSAAGNYANNCSIGKIISRGDLRGGGQVNREWRYAEFIPGEPCGRAYAIVDSGQTVDIDGITLKLFWIFRVKGPSPEFFGTISPQAQTGGFTPPADGDLTPTIWNDGISQWQYRSTFVGTVSPIAPTNNVFYEIDYDGPGVQFVDDAGSFNGNRYPSRYEPYDGPPIVLNGEFLNWTGVQTAPVTAAAWAAGVMTLDLGAPLSVSAGESFSVTVSGMTPAAWNGTYTATALAANKLTCPMTADPGLATGLGTVSTPRVLLGDTAAQPAGGFYASRPTGGATVSRIAGSRGGFAMQVQRMAGTTSTEAIYGPGVSITGERLRELRGKYPSFKMRMWRGPKFSDNNSRPGWEMRWLPVPGTPGSGLLPANAIFLANGSLPVALTEAVQDFTLTSAVTLPVEAGQLVLRLICTPVLGSAKSISVVSRGAGYTSPPTVNFSGGGDGAVLPQAEAVVAGGRVTRITLISAGSGMTSVPTLTLTGGGGSGATATATVHVVGDVGDWFAIERLVCGPSDSDFSFVREPIEVTQLRLNAV